jgi:hypothetical protein
MGNEQLGRKFCLKGVILGVTIIKGKVYACANRSCER